MVDIEGPLTDEGRKTTGEALQACVVDLVDLALTSKQLHWHLQGPRFRDVHLQLDVVVEMARKWTDVLAERSVTIGAPVDGRPATVARESGVDEVSTGWVRDADAVAQMAATLTAMGQRFQERIDATGSSDPVSQDQIIAAAEDVQEQSWWFQSMNA